jgi:phytoene dehydrogenase-like protein
MRTSTNHYDAVVIGGGHNGLVAAGYRARLRQKVLVLERRYEPPACWRVC